MRQTGREAGGQTDRQAERLTIRQTYIQSDRQIGRQADRLTCRRADGQKFLN